MQVKVIALVAVSIVIAVLLATALGSFTHVPDSALADVATPNANVGAGSSRPSSAGKNYLPIIFLNSATAGSAWLLAGNAGTDWATDFLGTTDNMTLTFRVSNTIAYRIIPAVDPTYGFAPNVIGGSGTNNVVPGLSGATIAGGGATAYPNVITGTGHYATIGGGFFNTASGYTSLIGGGRNNIASGDYATVGGGNHNIASGSYAIVGGGSGNTANIMLATVVGGANNSASGTYSTIGGGHINTVTGSHATIPGGYGNVAFGDYSLAAGKNAQALHQGAFVWADSTGLALGSERNDQFLIRASGGITLYTNPTMTVGASLYGGSGSWNTLSNKNLKANFADVDSRAILERVSELPITTWNYKTQDESIRHIGPMAQDFAAAFNVGENDTTISTVDAQGVALAAIKGLAQENKELKERNEKNEKELKELLELRERVAALEAQSGAPNAIAWRYVVTGAAIALVAMMWVRRKS